MHKPTFLARSLPSAAWFVLLLFLVLAVWHLRDPFFFYDEWDLLDEYVSGRVDVFRPHNEHLYILGKPLFYFLSSRFSTLLWVPHVLLLFIHTLNAWMVGRLVSRASCRELGLGAAVVFALHPFHVDNLHMLIQISALLQQTCFLSTLLLLFGFVDDRREWRYVLILCLQFIGIGWFGTSLTSNLLTVVCAALLFTRYGVPLRRLVPLGLAFVASTSLYWWLGGYRIEATLAKSLGEVLAAGQLIFSAWGENLPRVLTGFVFHPPLSVTIAVWLIVGAAGQWWFRRSPPGERHNGMLYLLVGMVLYLAYLVPIGLTRHGFGVDIGIATRYTYYYLPGVLLMLSVILRPMLAGDHPWLRRFILLGFSFYLVGMIFGARYATHIWNERNVENMLMIGRGGGDSVLTAHPTLSADRLSTIWQALR